MQDYNSEIPRGLRQAKPVAPGSHVPRSELARHPEAVKPRSLIRRAFAWIGEHKKGIAKSVAVGTATVATAVAVSQVIEKATSAPTPEANRVHMGTQVEVVIGEGGAPILKSTQWHEPNQGLRPDEILPEEIDTVNNTEVDLSHGPQTILVENYESWAPQNVPEGREMVMVVTINGSTLGYIPIEENRNKMDITHIEGQQTTLVIGPDGSPTPEEANKTSVVTKNS
ncbi:MAG: hypothetical protein HY344_01405 [Candidatus Levybacteria bacterium]|nr:hypothetical protein [Candidatus Levybacteria bacterium]